LREPTFIIGKDFVPGLQVRSGIANAGGQIRPYEIRGSSGIVPKVKVNYTEIGAIAGVTKE
jgi:hypothetical protein